MSRTWAIRMSPDSQSAIDAGNKTETRRANPNWLKAKRGDRLRILNCKGRVSLLEMTHDAYEQPLSELTYAGCFAEGITRTLGGYRRPGYPESYGSPFGAYYDWWDEINAGKPGLAAKDDPSPVVLTFREVEPTAKGTAAQEPIEQTPPNSSKAADLMPTQNDPAKEDTSLSTQKELK